MTEQPAPQCPTPYCSACYPKAPCDPTCHICHPTAPPEPDEAEVAALAETIIEARYWWPREMISTDRERGNRDIARAVLAAGWKRETP